MKVLVYQNDNGGISIVTPAPKAQFEGEADDAFLMRVAAQSIPEGKEYKIIDASLVPAREDRQNWNFNDIQGE